MWNLGHFSKESHLSINRKVGLETTYSTINTSRGRIFDIIFHEAEFNLRTMKGPFITLVEMGCYSTGHNFGTYKDTESLMLALFRGLSK